MTIPEASQLVLQAGAMGQGGEIFILDMGEPVKIVDLARDLITLSGLRPTRTSRSGSAACAPARSCSRSCRPSAEHADKTKHPKVFIGRIKPHELERRRPRGRCPARASRSGTATDRVRGALGEIVPEYGRAHPTGKATPPRGEQALSEVARSRSGCLSDAVRN